MVAGKVFKRERGFTLIELLVTIAVAVILATVAVPGFQNLVAENRRAADFNEILTGLTYARSEAVKRRQEVSAVITSNGGVWRLDVQHDGDVIKEMEARHDRTAVTPAPNTVSFNSLGRRTACVESDVEGLSKCVINISNASGDRKVEVHLSGRIERMEDS